VSQETTSRSFDELARGLANGSISRRKAIKFIAATTLGGILGLSGMGTAFAKNKTCAQWCAAVFGANTPAAGRCTSDAAHGTGLCSPSSCGPATLPSSVCCTRNSSNNCTSYSGASCCGSDATCLNGSCCAKANACGSTCLAAPCDSSQCLTCDSSTGTCVGCTSGQTCQAGTCCTSNGGTCTGGTQCCSGNCKVTSAGATDRTCVESCIPSSLTTCTPGTCPSACGCQAIAPGGAFYCTDQPDFSSSCSTSCDCPTGQLCVEVGLASPVCASPCSFA
jgi:hypothetical protein